MSRLLFALFARRPFVPFGSPEKPPNLLGFVFGTRQFCTLCLPSRKVGKDRKSAGTFHSSKMRRFGVYKFSHCTQQFCIKLGYRNRGASSFATRFATCLATSFPSGAASCFASCLPLNFAPSFASNVQDSTAQEKGCYPYSLRGGAAGASSTQTKRNEKLLQGLTSLLNAMDDEEEPDELEKDLRKLLDDRPLNLLQSLKQLIAKHESQQQTTNARKEDHHSWWQPYSTKLLSQKKQNGKQCSAKAKRRVGPILQRLRPQIHTKLFRNLCVGTFVHKTGKRTHFWIKSTHTPWIKSTHRSSLTWGGVGFGWGGRGWGNNKPVDSKRSSVASVTSSRRPSKLQRLDDAKPLKHCYVFAF